MLKLKNHKKLLIWSIILFTVFAMIAFTLFSPVPISFLLRLAFSNGMAVAPDDYDDMEQSVLVTKDLEYPSKWKSNLADIYIPKEENGPFPVVLWIHGGAFVGGDKSDIEVYATALASKGIATVCINYLRAPEAKYPTPVHQTAEAYQWLCSSADEYKLDMNRLIIAGDSAGAHIASQFAAIQSNEAYADEMAMDQIVPLESFRALLLFCGPFDVSQFSQIDNSVMRFVMGQAAWAYFGRRDWAEYYAEQATISNHITATFPPTFISDGNTGSFEDHGRGLYDALRLKNVSVETYFIPLDTEITKHEYQFIMNTPSGQESFLKTVDFIKRHVYSKVSE